MPNVDIPGVGVVAFPDSMGQDAINSASAHLYQQANPAPASPRTGAFSSPTGYSGAPDLPLQEKHPIEDAMAIYGGIQAAPQLARALPGIARGAVGLGSAALRVGMAGARELPIAGPPIRAMARQVGKEIGPSVESKVGSAVGLEALHGGGHAAQQIARDAEILARHDATEAATAKASEAGKHLAELRWGKASGSAASRVATRSAEPAAKAAGAAETRAASKAIPENGPTPGEKFNPPEELGPRHSVQRWSKSAKQMKTIENMPQPHLRAALAQDTKRLAALGKNAEKRAPVLHAVIEAMKKEIAHRAATTGVHGY